MASTMNNQAAWQQTERASHFTVEAGPDHSQPADDEVVIKVHTVAINPVDWMMQGTPFLKFEYPWILGSDAAGEVALVGKKVTKVKAGDRVAGHFLGLVSGSPKHGSFQQYATTRERVVTKLPDNISFAQGTVLPLAISTSVDGLFNILKLSLPSLTPKEGKGTVVIWGAGTSIASIGIQLARAAGYKVITTARAENFEYARSLGASQVFDYRESSTVDEIKKALRAENLAGVFDCIGKEASTRSCAEILSSFGGGKVALTSWPPKDLPGNVETQSSTVDDYPTSIWGEFVPAALANGLLVPKPEPLVIKGGVQKIQEAMDLQKKGVSAHKIVVQIVEQE